MRSLLLLAPVVYCALFVGAKAEESVGIEQFILGSWQETELKTSISIYWYEYRADGTVALDHRRGLFSGTWKKTLGMEGQVDVVIGDHRFKVFRAGENLILKDGSGERSYERRRSVHPKEPNQPPQRNAGSRPSSGDSPASETPFSLGPPG